MRLLSVVALLGSVSGSTSAFAQADPIPNDLATVFGNHLKTAYLCQKAVGVSQFGEARVVVENVLRSTGLPAYTAISTVDEIVSRIAADPEAQPPLFNECVASLASSRRQLLDWKTQFHHLEEHAHDADEL